MPRVDFELWLYNDVDPTTQPQTFSMLERIDIAFRKRYPSGATVIHWRCRCSYCGNTVTMAANNIKRNLGCGCRRGKSNLKHGHSGTGARSKNRSPTYATWQAMKKRCRNPKKRHYYGKVVVCDRWANSFENFLEDMGERPEGMTLDRYPNPEGNYEPGNCRWATPKEQRHNRRKGGQK